MVPSKSDWDELFKDFADHPATMQAEVGALLKTAKESERAKTAVVAFAQPVFSCLTAGGFNPVPLLKVLLIGFWLSGKYHEKNAQPGIPMPSDEALSKWLEGIAASVDTDNEGGKHE